MQTDADTKPQSKLDMALHWAARGFHVFPVEADGKQPVTSNGLYDATTDPETIRNWWQCPLTGSAMDWNIGASPRDGRHVVVDLDVKGGRNGIAEYEALGGVVGGLVTQTPSGGRHVWLTGPDTQNTAGTVAPGVDTRGSTGHVLMPGSTINGAAYEVVSDDPILPAPDWLLTRVPLRTERDRTRIVVTMVENDQPPNVERFTEHCRRAEPAVAGVFHDLSRNLAAEATRCAVSVEKAIEVMLAEWVPRCSGFFEDGRNERWPADVAASYAWAMGFREHGIHSVDAERLAFEGVSIVPPPPDTATTPAAGCGETTDSPMYAGWRRVCSTSLAGQPIPPREWLVDQWLSPDHVTVLFGEGGAGKSILMQQLMLACATGRDWLGLRTTPLRHLRPILRGQRGRTAPAAGGPLPPARRRSGRHRPHVLDQRRGYGERAGGFRPQRPDGADVAVSPASARDRGHRRTPGDGGHRGVHLRRRREYPAAGDPVCSGGAWPHRARHERRCGAHAPPVQVRHQPGRPGWRFYGLDR